MTPLPEQDDLDLAIQRYYAAEFDEDARIQTRSVGGRVELERTRRLIGGRLAPGSRVLDVGGATGVHSRWLAEAGHDVTLIDPVPAQVGRAAAISTADLHILRTGEWANTAGGFPGGHLHTVAELRTEVEEAGFTEVEIHGVEGPTVGALELVADDPELLDRAVRLADRLDAALADSEPRANRSPDLAAEASPHLLAVARRP